ncbi:hypothetical protein BCR44DRAFT_38377, partial [Catenaria anguillulae PL171]
MDQDQMQVDPSTASAAAAPPAAPQAPATPAAPSKPGAGAKLMFGKHGRPIVIQPDTNPPSRTLYCRNLPERMGHTTLRRHLMRQFENFGEIVQVRCSKAILKRGQAWVIFKRLEDAQIAYKEMQDAQFLGKPMIVQYAKMTSRVVASELGQLEEYADKHAKRAEERVKELAERQSKRAALAASAPRPAVAPMQPLAMPMGPLGMPLPPPPPSMAALAAGATGVPPVLPPGFVPPLPAPAGFPGMPPPPPGMPLGAPPPPPLAGAGAGAGAGAPSMPMPMPPIGAPGSGAAAAAHAMAAVPDDLVPPNPTLVVQGLPKGITQQEIAAVFGAPRFEGLSEVRMVPGRDIAFVEYVNEVCSGRAKTELHETSPFEGKDEVVKVTFR